MSSGQEQHAQAAYDRNELVLGGALADPVDGAMLIFRGPSSAASEAFAQADPYVTKGRIHFYPQFKESGLTSAQQLF